MKAINTTGFSHKSVEWSYPTSSNAQKFKMGKSGCWSLWMIEAKTLLPFSLYGYKTKADAMQAAKEINLPFTNAFFKYENIEHSEREHY